MRKRFVQIDGVLVEVRRDHVQPRSAAAAHNIIPDIEPYRSQIDGSVIGGRRQHREHLREHGCIEVGNEKLKPWGTIEPKVDWKEALRETMGRKGLL